MFCFYKDNWWRKTFNYLSKFWRCNSYSRQISSAKELCTWNYFSFLFICNFVDLSREWMAFFNTNNFPSSLYNIASWFSSYASRYLLTSRRALTSLYKSSNCLSETSCTSDATLSISPFYLTFSKNMCRNWLIEFRFDVIAHKFCWSDFIALELSSLVLRKDVMSEMTTLLSLSSCRTFLYGSTLLFFDSIRYLFLFIRSHDVILFCNSMCLPLSTRKALSASEIFCSISLF